VGAPDSFFEALVNTIPEVLDKNNLWGADDDGVRDLDRVYEEWDNEGTSVELDRATCDADNGWEGDV
jgi:hypothetical protein